MTVDIKTLRVGSHVNLCGKRQRIMTIDALNGAIGMCGYLTDENGVKHPLGYKVEDIWDYIKRFNLPIADIYHKGAMRTGCMGCGFGAQFADDTRFRVLYRNYPKCYDMVMDYTNNGVTFREALRKALAVNGLYLPDEQPPTLFDIIND